MPRFWQLQTLLGVTYVAFRRMVRALRGPYRSTGGTGRPPGFGVARSRLRRSRDDVRRASGLGTGRGILFLAEAAVVLGNGVLVLVGHGLGHGRAHFAGADGLGAAREPQLELLDERECTCVFLL